LIFDLRLTIFDLQSANGNQQLRIVDFVLEMPPVGFETIGG